MTAIMSVTFNRTSTGFIVEAFNWSGTARCNIQ